MQVEGLYQGGEEFDDLGMIKDEEDQKAEVQDNDDLAAAKPGKAAASTSSQGNVIAAEYAEQEQQQQEDTTAPAFTDDRVRLTSVQPPESNPRHGKGYRETPYEAKMRFVPFRREASITSSNTHFALLCSGRALTLKKIAGTVQSKPEAEITEDQRRLLFLVSLYSYSARDADEMVRYLQHSYSTLILKSTSGLLTFTHHPSSAPGEGGPSIVNHGSSLRRNPFECIQL